MIGPMDLEYAVQNQFSYLAVATKKLGVSRWFFS